MPTDQESPLLSNLSNMYIFSDQPAAVRKVFDFYDKDHDEILDPMEFSDMCYDMGVQLTDEEAQACCALMDRDGDGKVVFEEVLEWWCSSSNIFRLDEKKFQIAQFAIGLFRYYDTNRDGYITREQYDEGRAILKATGHPEYAPWVDRAFDEFNCIDDDEWVTMNEFMHHVLELYFPEHQAEQTERTKEIGGPNASDEPSAY